MDAQVVRHPGVLVRSARRQTCVVTAAHYFSAQPSTPAQRSEIEFSVAGRGYRLTVASGVFSAGRLDPGTAVLLRKGDLPTAGVGRVFLHLRCGYRAGACRARGWGYGPIACVLASEAPEAVVHAIDVNSRARELTALNAETLGLGG